MKYVFIVNPASGKKTARDTVAPAIHNWFKGRQYDYEILVTEYPKHATDLVRELGRQPGQYRVCACGGDGTVSEVAAGAVGAANLEVAVYPCGGGNDFIKCFGRREDFLNFDAVVGGSTIPVDMLRVNDDYCINLMSVGIDADVNAGILKYRKLKAFRGPIAYNLSLVEHLIKPIGKQLRVEIGDTVLEDNMILIAAGNGRVYGGGYCATPEARLDDGLIDVVSVDKMPLLRIAKVLAIYKRGEHIVGGRVIDSIADKVRFFRTERLHISAPQELIVNIDGESIRASEVEVSIIKQALRLVLPPGFIY